MDVLVSEQRINMYDTIIVRCKYIWIYMNHSHIESNVVKPHFIPTAFSTPSSNDWPFTVPPGGRSQRFHQVADHMTSLWPWRSGIVTIWKSFQGSKNDFFVRLSKYGIRDKWILWNLFGFLVDHKHPHKFGTFLPSVCSFFVPAGTGVNRKRGAHRSPAM